MYFARLYKWLLLCGSALCTFGVGLSFYAQSLGGSYYAKLYAENWNGWIVLAGLLTLLAGAATWSIRARIPRCLIAALVIAAFAVLLARFGRINPETGTAIFIPIIYGMAIATLLLIVVALTRYLTRKIGRWGYLAGLAPVLLVAIALFALYQGERPNQGPPKIVPGANLPKLIKSLPQQAHFSISGLSFFNGTLYVGTNLGIVEISAGAPLRLYQFQKSDSVVSGPWLDRGDRLLWATDDHTQELVRFDGQSWVRMEPPLPPKGFYTRGEVLEGNRPIGNSDGFWLAAGQTAWKWNSESARWDLISNPESANSAAVIGILPIRQQAFLIVRHELLPFLPRPDGDLTSDEVVEAPDPTAPPLERSGKAFLADTWTVTGDAGYICTKDGRLLRVTTERVAPLDAPGSCEALAADDDFSLFVSIKSQGVFRYTEDQWTLVAQSPYPSGSGEYWARMAVSHGQLAFAIDAKPVIAPGYSGGLDMHFVQNAPTSLWVLVNGKFAPVSF